ncbi:hypothetical protein HPB51_005087 [Rhipicephalus microplus]|uniref:Uncharacterized protein n=1 Tax=Rhipicephalus microplus TaxID=6941 RepID=A0A9J6DKS4_RHIMP|nr:hypothetical protein HPB51_005087 [Rhipicephalus microplus]
MLNKHVFFLVQMLVAISSSPMPASDQDFCPADVSRALSGEVHGNSTFMNYCSFIEQPGASCALASHAFTSFHVTSSGPGLIYSPPPLRIFSGRGGSVPATMLNKHVFFLVQATGAPVENLKDTLPNTLYTFTWDLPKHDKVVVHIPEGANDIQMGPLILQALVEACQKYVTKDRRNCRTDTNSNFLDVGTLLAADCSGPKVEFQKFQKVIHEDTMLVLEIKFPEFIDRTPDSIKKCGM